jgi:putative ATPase
VGLADPQALPLAIAAQQAVHFVGMPEGFYALSHATLYLACAPKGNAVGRAYYAALTDVRNTRNEPVPLHLRNAATGFMQTLGYGAGYRYAHSEPEAQAAGERPPTTSAHGFRPPNVAHRRYLEPGVQGREAEIAQWVQRRYETDA